MGAVFIGTIGFFVKLAGGAVHPLVLGFYRVFFAFLLLLIFSPFLDKTTFQLKKRNLKLTVLLGFLFALNLSLTVLAYTLAPIENIALILSLTPVFVFIFAALLLKEKLTKQKLITLLIATIGLIILNPLRVEGLWGNLLAILVVITGGLMFTLLRKANMNDSIGNVVWFFFFASIFLVPFPFIYGFGTITLPIISLGVISTGAAYLFYSLGYEFIEAQIGSIVSNIIHPIVAIFLATVLLGELINPQVIIGGALLILAGTYMQTHIHHKRILHH